jgi:hypothetical protein
MFYALTLALASFTAPPAYSVTYVCSNTPDALVIDTKARTIRVQHCPDAPEPDPVFSAGFE